MFWNKKKMIKKKISNIFSIFFLISFFFVLKLLEAYAKKILTSVLFEGGGGYADRSLEKVRSPTF